MTPPELDLPRVDRAEIVIDGAADEASWASAIELPEATVYAPSDELAPVGRMRVRLVADGQALYAHFAVTDPEPEAVRAGLGRRDTREDDAVGLYLDPRGDGRRAYLLAVNPIGVQTDALYLPGARNVDDAWDAVWRSAGHRTETGYEVEVAIPWAAVKISGQVDQIGLLAWRQVARRGQSYAWPKVDPGTDLLQAFARVNGPGVLPRRAGLELLPEVTASYADPPVDTGRLAVAGVSPGLTVRYAPESALTLVGTFNPDFSQLESDEEQIDVNQRYPLTYEEKRPFFLEGQDWFAHPVASLVYTRSMNVPLYGARGVVEFGPVGLAALHVLDVAPPPSVNEGEGWTEDELAGHSAFASVARARVSAGGDSYVGLVASDRSVLGTDLYNRLVGVDSRVRFDERSTLDLAIVGSATVLSPAEAPVLAPRARAVGRFSGEKIWASLGLDAISPGFRDENGYAPIEDWLGGLAEAHYNLYPAVAWLPRLSFEPVDVKLAWTYDGDARERAYDPSVWAVFGNGAFVKVDQKFAGESFAGAWIPYANTELYAESAFGEVLRGEVGGTFGTAPWYDDADPRAGALQVGWAWVEVQPVPRLTLGVSPEVARMADIGGDPLFVAWTGRARAQLFLTPTVWVRVVHTLTGDVVGDSRSAGWRLEPVAAWELTPGRAVYVGGAYGVEDEPTWQVYGKVGWLFGV